jgi:UDP-glucose 4,6-dehydratase
LQKRGEPFAAVSRKQIDYTRFPLLLDFLRTNRPSLVVNAAGYTGKPNVDACEDARAETLQGNTILPINVSNACQTLDIACGHVSSGCIYDGSVVLENGKRHIIRDLTSIEAKKRMRNAPESLVGFTEEDEPNFSFRHGPCSFYSGTKALAEETLADYPRTYLWRLRIPFNEVDNARNYLSKLQRYSKVYDNTNSVSHLDDYVHACLDLWKVGAPFGAYNVTNPGFITTRQVIDLIQKRLQPQRTFEFWKDDDEFYRMAAKTPRSNCILDPSKLLATGVRLRGVEDALADALDRWIPEVRTS